MNKKRNSRRKSKNRNSIFNNIEILINLVVLIALWAQPIKEHFLESKK